MPDKGIKPPNKRVSELVAEITFDTFHRFEDEKILNKRNEQITVYLINELAKARVLIEEYQKIIDEK